MPGPTRAPHRSTQLHLLTMIDVRGLMDDNGRALIAGKALEELLSQAIAAQVRSFLEQGRAKIPGHP